MSLDATWKALQAMLDKGTEIRNWTAAKGFIGDTFTVTSVMHSRIEVDTPGAQNIQKLSITDFKAVYNVWRPYLEGKVSRKEICDTTRVSKYVIGMLHWLETR